MTRTVGCATAPMKTAEWEEAASAQAVKRGHQVTMIKVPDDEDDTSFREWVASGCPTISPKQDISVLPTPPESPSASIWPLPTEGVALTYIRMKEMTSLMVATPIVASAKVLEAPHRWMRPFEVSWTLCAIREARNNNATHAALTVWIHCDKAAELTDELLSELRLGKESAREQLYELCEPPRIIH